MAVFPSSRPRWTSIKKQTTSASAAPPQAVVTMARSSRRRGRKMPGVSTKISCDAPAMAMPRTMPRVVCTLWVTIDSFVPTSAFSSVDLPAFGAPIRATKPQRVSISTMAGIPVTESYALARHEGGGGSHLGEALGAPLSLGRLLRVDIDGDHEARIVV